MAQSQFTIPPHDAAGSAARSTIAVHLRALITQIPGAQTGEPEPIHQVRVAARRLRSDVRLFSPYISSLRPKVMEARLKWLGKQAGAVRDLDVLEKSVRKRARKLDPQIVNDLEPLLEKLRLRRSDAASHLTRSLASSRYKALVAKLSAPIAITTSGDEAFGAVAADLFAPMLKSVLRAGEKLHEDPTADELHRLRKRAKALRYALEMMLGIDRKHLGPMVKELENLQDLMGGYHDAVVAVRRIKEFATTRELPANVAFACGALAEAFRRHEFKLKRRGLKEWNRFLKNGPNRIVKKALDQHPKEVSPDDAVHYAPRSRRRARG